MPYVRVETSVAVEPATASQLTAALSRLCADTLGKPEAYVMVALQAGVPMRLGGAAGPVAFVDLRSIGGLTPRTCQALVAGITEVLQAVLKVPPDRTYLNLTDVKAAHWGHDGGTFG
jgi:phenylpyruvate tautomerase PptA (4-oxalocrotonate tautomerase family)